MEVPVKGISTLTLRSLLDGSYVRERPSNVDDGQSVSNNSPPRFDDDFGVRDLLSHDSIEVPPHPSSMYWSPTGAGVEQRSIRL